MVSTGCQVLHVCLLSAKTKALRGCFHDQNQCVAHSNCENIMQYSNLWLRMQGERGREQEQKEREKRTKVQKKNTKGTQIGATLLCLSRVEGSGRT